MQCLARVDETLSIASHCSYDPSSAKEVGHNNAVIMKCDRISHSCTLFSETATASSQRPLSPQFLALSDNALTGEVASQPPTHTHTHTPTPLRVAFQWERRRDGDRLGD